VQSLLYLHLKERGGDSERKISIKRGGEELSRKEKKGKKVVIVLVTTSKNILFTSSSRAVKGETSFLGRGEE